MFLMMMTRKVDELEGSLVDRLEYKANRLGHCVELCLEHVSHDVKMLNPSDFRKVLVNLCYSMNLLINMSGDGSQGEHVGETRRQSDSTGDVYQLWNVRRYLVPKSQMTLA